MANAKPFHGLIVTATDVKKDQTHDTGGWRNYYKCVVEDTNGVAGKGTNTDIKSVSLNLPPDFPTFQLKRGQEFSGWYSETERQGKDGTFMAKSINVVGVIERDGTETGEMLEDRGPMTTNDETSSEKGSEGKSEKVYSGRTREEILETNAEIQFQTYFKIAAQHMATSTDRNEVLTRLQDAYWVTEQLVGKRELHASKPNVDRADPPATSSTENVINTESVLNAKEEEEGAFD